MEEERKSRNTKKELAGLEWEAKGKVKLIISSKCLL
jgi:hypothetical protein